MSPSTIPTSAVFIDPSYRGFCQDRLFDLPDPTLNRDGQLVPFSRLRNQLSQNGRVVHSADFFFDGRVRAEVNDYYSLGLRGYRALRHRNGLALRGFVIMEPPVVAPQLYADLPRLTADFDAVYVHNTHGDGYSLQGVRQAKLRRFYWPTPYDGVLENHWSVTERQRKLVVINGNHNPRFRSGELYTKRIEAMVALSRLHAVDLYGKGWDKLWSPKSMFLPYLLNRRTLLAIYKGPCRSKYEVLSRYHFCLCLENQSLDGYITEKLFDCLYAGTVPLYLGPKDVTRYVPRETFVDARHFASWEEAWDFLRSMPAHEIERIREAGRVFLQSPAGLRFYHSLEYVFGLRE